MMRTLILALLALPALVASGRAQDVAVRAGKLITRDGNVIENGTLVVSGGRVAAVGGADLEVPFDTLLYEFPDATVFGGFCLAHTSSGMDRANENIPVAPFLDVRDSIDPVSFYFEDELREGVVALGVIPGPDCVIGGVGLVVAPSGMTVEEMTLADDMGMKVAIGPQRRWSRSAQLAELREAEAKLGDKLHAKGQELLDAAKEREDLAAIGEEVDDDVERGGFVRFGDDFPGKSLISRSEVDSQDRALVELLNGDLRVWLWSPTASDVHYARAWAEEHGLLGQSVFVVTPEAWKAADILKETGRPVVLENGLWHVENDPVTGKEKRTFAPKVFHEAGVPFAITSQEFQMGPDRLSYQAATCVREGLPREVALAAVTRVPAMTWGQEERLGGLQVGADGTFVVLSGDPLDAGSKVLEVWVRGRRAYERSKDERLQRLLEGEKSAEEKSGQENEEKSE